MERTLGDEARVHRFVATPIPPAAAPAENPDLLAAAPSSRKPAAASAPGGPPAALRREIQKQKEYVAATVKAVRGYVLPAGSEPAFVFRPVRAGRRRGGRAR
jgi:hypothetical protein